MSQKKVKRLDISCDYGAMDEDGRAYDAPLMIAGSVNLPEEMHADLMRVDIFPDAEKDQVIALLFRMAEWLDANWDELQQVKPIDDWPWSVLDEGYQERFDDMRTYWTAEQSNNLWRAIYGPLNDDVEDRRRSNSEDDRAQR